MSWLVSSIANSLKLDDDDDDFDPKSVNANTSSTSNSGEAQSPESPNPNPNNIDADQSIPPRGVKEDLSEISKTLTRQFWGVASFLAPPPSQIPDRDPQPDDDDPNSVDPAGIVGIRNDLSEIGGKFRTGISKLSSNKAVSEFTKIASNILQFGSDKDLTMEEYAQRGVVGVTEEVVAFARDIALHPETWLDFPLPDDDDDDQDFDLSDAQQEHAFAVESLAPELAALRTELCLGYMSEACFWKIYFVLVHPRLSRHDAEILSTPEIVRARAMLAHELQNRGKSKSYESATVNNFADTTKLSNEEHLLVPVVDQSESVPVEISVVEPASSVEANLEIDKHPISTEIPVIDKAVVEEASVKQSNIEKPAPSTSANVVHKDENDENDADDWLREENNEAGEFKGTSYPLGNDDDISFSDLEEDDEVPTNSKKEGHSNEKVSSDTLNKKESSDWLDVEDIDVA